MAVGGLSQYESFKILKDKNFPYTEGFRKELDRIEEVARDIKENPDFITKKYLGHVYIEYKGQDHGFGGNLIVL